MESEIPMFCFQCEQTAGGAGCKGKSGVCGKTSEVAGLQDELTGALIGLASSNVCEGLDEKADLTVMKALFATLTNVDFDADDIRGQMSQIQALSGGAPAYDMSSLWNAQEDVRSLKSLILFGIRGMAAYAYHAAVLGKTDRDVVGTMYKGLRTVGSDADADELLAMVMEVGRSNLTCMEMLDAANREAFGVPGPVKVSTAIEKGPAIIVTGHDLKDLKALLEQTEGRGINVYTHGEMLPAHAYPELSRFKHLKGHYGTAWQNQRSEFDGIGVPVLFTTNCLMPPKDSYIGNVFTSGPVCHPGTCRVDGEDFSPIIEKALSLGGFAEDRAGTVEYTTGFGREAILANAGAIVDGVKTGAIGHFFLVGGCDGAKPGRSYFREFVEKTPADSVVLTLACGKFRFNDLNLGDIGGIPRLLDMGQCNDAYGAIKVALALADAFGCGVNDLPLSMVLSWYEQKAVCILLTLLYLGVRGIYLGPSLPAFVSPGVLKVLVDNYDIHPISDVDGDMKAMLGRS